MAATYHFSLSENDKYPIYTKMLNKEISNSEINLKASFTKIDLDVFKREECIKYAFGYTLQNLKLKFWATINENKHIDKFTVSFAISQKTPINTNDENDEPIVNYVFSENTWTSQLTLVSNEKIGAYYTYYFKLTFQNDSHQSDCQSCWIYFPENTVFIYDASVEDNVIQ